MKHFTLEELCFSDVAIRYGQDNTPGPDEQANLLSLGDTVLDPAREALGPIHVNSGFRSPPVNVLVGGSSTSQHMRGEAADLRPINATLRELAEWLVAHAPFDQLIWEFGAWVHVSHKRMEPGRGMILAAYRRKGRGTVYRVVGTLDEAIALTKWPSK